MTSSGSFFLFGCALLLPVAFAWGAGFAVSRRQRVLRLAVAIAILLLELAVIPQLLMLWPIALFIWPTALTLAEMFVTPKRA